MNSELIKTCFDEISHLIFDADKKVNIFKLSNDWHVTVNESEKILLNWLNDNKNKTLSKEYLIRGQCLQNGNSTITIIPENKLSIFEKQFDNFTSTLYSLEMPSNTNRRLNTDKLIDCSMINLPFNSGERNCKVLPLPNLSPAKKLAKIKKEESIQIDNDNKIQLIKAEVKEEETVIEKTPIKKESSVKVERKTEKNESTKKKEPLSKSIKTGKASITSFFPSKPVNSNGTTNSVKSEIKDDHTKTSSSTTTVTKENKQKSILMPSEKNPIKIEPMKNDDNNLNIKRKRTLSDIVDSDSVHSSDDDDNKVIPNSPKEEIILQKNKKIKTVKKQNAKKTKEKPRKRILQHSVSSSSSSDDDDDDNNVDNEDNNNSDSDNKIKTENINDEKMETVDDKTDMKMDIDSVNKPRYKARRQVVKTYEGEDGYLVTVREMEQYSCSEDEADKKVNDSKIVTDNIGSSSVEGAAAAKKQLDKVNNKKIIQKLKTSTKQGLIKSFFTKK